MPNAPTSPLVPFGATAPQYLQVSDYRLEAAPPGGPRAGPWAGAGLGLPTAPGDRPGHTLTNRPPPLWPSQKQTRPAALFQGVFPSTPPVRKRPRDSRWGGRVPPAIRGPRLAVRSDVRGWGRQGRGRGSPDPGSRYPSRTAHRFGLARKSLAATTFRVAGRGGPFVTSARARAGRWSLGRHFRARGWRWSARGADRRFRTMTEADGLRQRRPLRPQVVTDDNRTPEAKGGR